MIKLSKLPISKNFFLYGVIGVLGLSIDLGLYYFFTNYYEINYQVANWASTSLGIGSSFLLNAYFNFGKIDHLWSRFFKFYTIGLLGILITAIILFLLVECLVTDAMLAKVVSVVIVFFIQYGLNKKLSFKDH